MTRRQFKWMMRLALLCAGVLLEPQLGAQSLRDPTLPPVAAGLSDSGALAGQPQSASELGGPLSVLRVDGRAHLVVGTRLYAQGQMLGQARIERITETEVWLREGSELRKVSNFSGVQRRSVPPAAAMPACAASAAKPSRAARSPKSSRPVAPCDSIQP